MGFTWTHAVKTRDVETYREVRHHHIADQNRTNAVRTAIRRRHRLDLSACIELHFLSAAATAETAMYYYDVWLGDAPQAAYRGTARVRSFFT